MTHGLKFDAATHRYTIDGRDVPSVTQVLGDLIPGWQAEEWYLQRGQYVHACLAIIAGGGDVDHTSALADQSDDDRAAIVGMVNAGRLFLCEYKPTIMAIEYRVASRVLQYAGTLDLLAWIDKKLTVIDWKASVPPYLPYQLAAYATAYNEGRDRIDHATHGIGVKLGSNGRYTATQHTPLFRFQRRWNSLLDAYRVRRECGKPEEGQKV